MYMLLNCVVYIMFTGTLQLQVTNKGIIFYFFPREYIPNFTIHPYTTCLHYKYPNLHLKTIIKVEG